MTPQVLLVGYKRKKERKKERKKDNLYLPFDKYDLFEWYIIYDGYTELYSFSCALNNRYLELHCDLRIERCCIESDR
jgi:hypothetical protein